MESDHGVCLFIFLSCSFQYTIINNLDKGWMIVYGHIMLYRIEWDGFVL